MPPIRLTAFFRDDDGHGFSESHDIDGGATITSLTPYLTNFSALMKQKRVPLLAADGFYIGCRASYKTADGSIAGDNILEDLPLHGPLTQGTEDLQMDACQIAVKFSMRNAASTAKSYIYLRAIPRQIATAGQLDFGTAVGKAWQSKLIAYQNALLQGNYGWVGVNPAATPRGEITGYVEGVDNRVTFTLNITNGIPMPVPPAGKTGFVILQASRINNSKSILNRTIVCTIESTTTVKSVKQIATTPFESNGTFAIIQKGLIPYAAAGSNRLSSRKTGRVFGVGRGRRSAATLH